MKYLKNIYVLALAVLAISCEKELEIVPDNVSDRITITSVASPDTVVTAYITRASYITEAYEIKEADYYNYFISINYAEKDATLSPYIIENAKVTLTVNDNTAYAMERRINPIYKTLSNAYVSDYKPKPGDKLRIDVEVDGYTPASATTIVNKTPSFEVKNLEKQYKEHPDYSESNLVELRHINSYMIDSAGVAKLVIHDPAGQKNHYRLEVRSNYKFKANVKSVLYSGTYVENIDIDNIYGLYESNDLIFRDMSLTKGWGGWQPYFSTIFDDSLFDGKDYEFEVESVMFASKATAMKRFEPYLSFTTLSDIVCDRSFEIELQSISAEMYDYLKSVMYYRISDSDKYSDPLGIVSNVEGGWGCFGSSSPTKFKLNY